MRSYRRLLVALLLASACSGPPVESRTPRAVREPAPPAPPGSPTQPVAPVPRPPVAPPPYGCVDHGDCVLFCPEVAGCCGNTCGCHQAVNKAYVEELTSDYARDCQKPPACPPVACAYSLAIGAACIEGRCVASSAGF